MEKFKEKTLGSKRIFDGRLLGVRVDTVQLPNKVKTTREIVEHPGAAAIIAVTDERELVLVRQFRQPAGEVLLEIPAGVPHKNEPGEEAARRELEEETGYYAKKIKKLWQGYASPGYSNEIIKYYLALDLNLQKQRHDEDEYTEVELVDFDECLSLIKAGEIRDNKTVVGITLANLNFKGDL